MTLRGAVKAAIGRAALTPLLAIRTRSSLQGRVNIAYLHYVGGREPYYDDFYRGSTLERFVADIELLGQHFEFRSLREILADSRPNGSDRPRLAITFDDGFDLIRNGVASVLEQRGVRATTFVITSMVDNANLMWRNKLSAIRSLSPPARYVAEYNGLMREQQLPEIAGAAEFMPQSQAWPMELKDTLADELWRRSGMVALDQFLADHRPYFTWDGLDEWVARGHDLGLHTATHPSCDRIEDPDVELEIVRPAAMLRDRFELEFLPFSYPFGARLPTAAEQALYDSGAIDCALGINGFAPRGTPRYKLERAPIEREVRFPVFGRAFLGSL